MWYMVGHYRTWCGIWWAITRHDVVYGRPLPDTMWYMVGHYQTRCGIWWAISRHDVAYGGPLVDMMYRYWEYKTNEY